MEATGENVRPLIPRCHHPAWSPDGKEIVCSRVGHSLPSTRNINPSSLLIADVETGAQRDALSKRCHAAVVVAERISHRVLVHSAECRQKRHRDDFESGRRNRNRYQRCLDELESGMVTGRQVSLLCQRSQRQHELLARAD